MLDYISAAYRGWLELNDAGKTMMLLFVVELSFIYFVYLVPANHFAFSFRDDGMDENGDCGRRAFFYGIIMTLICVCPLTAAVLMIYQSRFYDYNWIWSLVPVTMMLGVGLTEYLDKIRRFTGEKSRLQKFVGFGFVIAVMFFCSSMGVHEVQLDDGSAYSEAENVLAQIEKPYDEVVLWAPDDVVEYARQISGEIRLVYGRDMWDASLGAYTYDVYDDATLEMHTWMVEMGKRALGTNNEYYMPDPLTVMSNAVERGVNVMILPENTEEATLRYLESSYDARIVDNGLYFVYLNK